MQRANRRRGSGRPTSSMASGSKERTLLDSKTRSERKDSMNFEKRCGSGVHSLADMCGGSSVTMRVEA